MIRDGDRTLLWLQTVKTIRTAPRLEMFGLESNCQDLLDSSNQPLHSCAMLSEPDRFPTIRRWWKENPYQIGWRYEN